MPALIVAFQDKATEGPAFPDLDRENCIHLGEGSPPIHVVVLGSGMVSGKPSIALRIDLPDGTVIIAETSAALFAMAGRAITAKYPNLLG